MTTTQKSNAKLASELKQLGFRRGISSWEKSTFTKHITTSNWMGEKTSCISIEVQIVNNAIKGNDWRIFNTSISTKNFTTDKGFINGQVTLTANAKIEMIDTLNALAELS